MSSWWWLLLAGGASQIILFRTFKGHGSPSQKSHQQNLPGLYIMIIWDLVLISLQLFILLWHIQSLPDFASNQSIPKSFPSGPHLTWYFQLPRFSVFTWTDLGPSTANHEVRGHGTWLSHAQGMLLQGLPNGQSSGGVGVEGLVGWKLSKLPSWQNLGIIHPLDPYHMSIWGA